MKSTESREVRGSFGKASRTHCIYNEIIQKTVWERVRSHSCEKGYICLGTKKRGNLKYDLTSSMDPLFDGESELDEMQKGKKCLSVSRCA